MDEDVGEVQMEQTPTSEEKSQEALSIDHDEKLKRETKKSGVDEASDTEVSGGDKRNPDLSENLVNGKKETKLGGDSETNAKEENSSHDRERKRKEKYDVENRSKSETDGEESLSEGNRSHENGGSFKDNEYDRENTNGKGGRDPKQSRRDAYKSQETKKKQEDEKALNDDKDNTKDKQVHAFNLINPEKLSKQLEVAKLDDEQTEELLLNAKKLNAQLRKILRHQQLGEEPSKAHRQSETGTSPSRRPRTGGKSSDPHRHKEGGRSASPKKRTDGGRGPSAGRRRGSGREILPPIHGKEANPRSGQTRVKSAKSHTGSERSSFRRSARPEWNDRFSYM